MQEKDSSEKYSLSVLGNAVLEKALHNKSNAASTEIPADSNFVDLQRWAAVGWSGCLVTLVGQKASLPTTASPRFNNGKKLDRKKKKKKLSLEVSTLTLFRHEEMPADNAFAQRLQNPALNLEPKCTAG